MVLDNGILRPRKNKRKLPLRKIVDADFVSSNSSARIMDDLLLPSQHDRAILSELHNIRNSFDFNNRDKSLLPHIVLGLNNTKKKELKQAVVITPHVQTYKERLKAQKESTDWSLDLSGHSIIPITLANDMTAKQQQQQQQEEEQEEIDDNDYTDDMYDDHQQQDTNHHSETNQEMDETVNNVNNNNNTKEEEDTSSKEVITAAATKEFMEEVEKGRFKNEESGTEQPTADILMEEAEQVVTNGNEVKADAVKEVHVEELVMDKVINQPDGATVLIKHQTPTSTSTSTSTTTTNNIEPPSFETPTIVSSNDDSEDDELWWMNSIDTKEDENAENFYDYIFEKMSVPNVAVAVSTTSDAMPTSKAIVVAKPTTAVTQVTMGKKKNHHKRKLDALKKSRAFDWSINNVVCKKIKCSSISKKRRQRLLNKLKRPYIIKKKIKSIWFIE